MATVTAFIRASKTDKNKSANVRFRLRDGRSFQLFHKSEFSIIPDKWDDTLQKYKARCIIDEKTRKDFDTAINKRKELIHSIYLQKGKTLTAEVLETEISKTLHPEQHKQKHQTLLQFVADYIAEIVPIKKHKKSGRLLADKNVQNYKATERRLKEFAESVGKHDFEFDEINQEFYDKFVAFLQSEITENVKGETVVTKKSFTQNTVGKHIQYLKPMLKEARKKELFNMPDSDLADIFYASKEETDTIYLNEKELQQLKDKDFSETPYLDRVRDWFLLLAWTGCRFSDLSKIAKTDIKDGFITFRQQKTNNKVTIPLHPVVVEILEKYDYDLPTEISNQKFNEYIKTACKEAELKSIETRTRTVGGKLTTETFEKHQLVTSHTGRRSFCTNMYKRGLPTIMIMSVSGHNTESAFLKYIKVRQDEHAKMMAEKWAEIYKK